MQKDLKDPGSTRFGTVADVMDHKGDIVGIWCGYYITITIYIYTGWWFGTLILFFHILGIVIPTD